LRDAWVLGITATSSTTLHPLEVMSCQGASNGAQCTDIISGLSLR